MINSMVESYGDNSVRDHYLKLGYDLDVLKKDDCYLTIENLEKSTVYLYRRYLECLSCPFTKAGEAISEENHIRKLNTEYAQEYKIADTDVDLLQEDSNGIICNITQDLGEFGIYKLELSNCRFTVLKDPVNIYLPIITVILIITAILLLRPIWKLFWRKCMTDITMEITKANESNTSGKERLKSLDTFRGIAITLMIFVNYGHGGYTFLEHAVWNGLHVADLVFPWFMWIMGVCIPISILSALKKGMERTEILKTVFRRSVILFGIGLFLGAGTYLNNFRIFGVLQRFGICYFVVAFIFLTVNSNNTKDFPVKFINENFKDILIVKIQWIAILCILAIHCLLTFVLEVPGCPKGYLGPGGIHKNALYKNCTGGATGYIDDVVLGSHVFRWPTIREIYKTGGFDPEGILGCLTSIVQVFIGSQAGLIVLMYKTHKNRLIRWGAWAVLTGVIGGILCKFSKEDGVIPLNKNLWSVSFVLVTSCLAFILLSICYYVMDMNHMWTGKPFLFAGMNATIMYVGHNMTGNNFLVRWYITEEEMGRTHFLTMIANVWSTAIWLLVAYYLYRIKFFLSI